ncbi:MAG: ABC transporter substrate-binding protein [Anaerolineae bacterium]|nr:ABC transporter substrate-binding protein [Anaerolineae bacterium]
MKNHLLHRLASLFIAIMLLISALPAAAQEGEGWPRTVTDAGGNPVTLDAPPQRIASVTIASDEILLSLITPERLIGVTSMATDPGISNVAAAAAAVPHRVTANPELLISLEPDLVIVATWTDSAVIDQLRDAGLTVFLMPSPVGIAPIQEAIALLGELVGAEESAAALVSAMDAELSAIAAATADTDPTRVLYLTPGNYTSGQPSTIAEAITAAGGTDVAAAAGVSQFEPLSDEFLLEEDPDVILLSGWTPWDPDFVENFRNNPLYTGLSAVQNGRVYLANDAHLSATSHFIVEGVADIAAILYPDQYPAFPLTVTDALGREVTLDSKPQTVASLTLGTDEILASLLPDAADRIVGLTYLVDTAGVSNLAETDLLASLTSTRVEADPEQLIALAPDLVLAATFTDGAVLQQLEDAGIAVVTVGNFTTVAAMLDNLGWLGDLLGARAEAQAMISDLTDRLEAVAARTAMVEQPASIIYLSTDNWVAGCATTLDDMITLAGGINAACAAGLMDWKQIDSETLLTLDPNVIVFSAWVDVESWLADAAVQGLSAVQQEWLVAGDDAHLSAVSQYIIDGVEDLQVILYPDLAN